MDNDADKFGSRDVPIRSAWQSWSVPYQVCSCKASMASPLEKDDEGVSLGARYLMINYS